MKKFFIFALAITLFTACSNSPKGDKADASDAKGAAEGEGTAYTVNTAESIVNWNATKIAYGHNGTINLSEGSLNVKDGNITGGSFTIDMNSIDNLDIEDEGKKAGLIGHLKGTQSGKEDDFFNVAKYPTSKFVISKVVKLDGDAENTHIISGDLTMKDVTKNVSFKANVDASGDTIKATSADFTINRTEWGIKFLATVLGIPADKAVSDDVGLKINLVATK